MELLLKRHTLTDVSTIGDLFVDGVKECFILEDPVREVYEDGDWYWRSDYKIPEKTAIPSGRYRIIINHSNRFDTDLPLLLDVPDFTGIRIHPGNWAHNTEGCLLPGQSAGDNAVWHSRDAFNPLFEKIKTALDNSEDVFITIENGFEARGHE